MYLIKNGVQLASWCLMVDIVPFFLLRKLPCIKEDILYHIVITLTCFMIDITQYTLTYCGHTFYILRNYLTF